VIEFTLDRKKSIIMGINYNMLERVQNDPNVLSAGIMDKYELNGIETEQPNQKFITYPVLTKLNTIEK
jgi:hypothetical protein